MKLSYKILLLLTFAFLSSHATAYKVLRVYPCGNSVGILTDNANLGWLVAREADVGEATVDRIMSVALVSYSTGAELGHVGKVTDAAPIAWCGIPNATRILALMIKEGN